jgi:hypothetical protein
MPDAGRAEAQSRPAVVRRMCAGHVRGERSERSLDGAEHARRIASQSVRLGQLAVVASVRIDAVSGRNLTGDSWGRCVQCFPAAEPYDLLRELAGASCNGPPLFAPDRGNGTRGVSAPPAPPVKGRAAKSGGRSRPDSLSLRVGQSACETRSVRRCRGPRPRSSGCRRASRARIAGSVRRFSAMWS